LILLKNSTVVPLVQYDVILPAEKLRKVFEIAGEGRLMPGRIECLAFRAIRPSANGLKTNTLGVRPFDCE
jgi:hypothetical protein